MNENTNDELWWLNEEFRGDVDREIMRRALLKEQRDKLNSKIPELTRKEIWDKISESAFTSSSQS